LIVANVRVHGAVAHRDRGEALFHQFDRVCGAACQQRAGLDRDHDIDAATAALRRSATSLLCIGDAS